MNCREFELEWAGLDDISAASLPPSMEEHRRACRACSEMVDDLTAIAEEAREYRLAAEPPERVWRSIRLQLEREGLIKEPGGGVALIRIRRRWWTALVPRAAYAAVFVVTLCGVYIASQLSNPAAPPTLAVRPDVPPSALVKPQLVGSDQDVDALLAKVPEDHRQIFVSNWKQVNNSIQTLSSFVDSHPDDPFARSQLMNAVQQRELLWDTLVKWEQF